ncbi:hypothetical protein ACQ4PT_006988 [Festuca glaucescens]
MAAATKNQPPPQAPAAATTVDPKFEWAEKAGSYVLRLTLPGFKKADFRVQVDGAGRLTVRSSRPAAAGPGSLHKVFQLPSTANLDEIAGRFEAGVLTLTVHKRASSLAPAPTSIEEIKRKPDVGKETKANEEEIHKEDALKKAAMDEATKKAQQQKQKQQEEEEKAKSRKQEQQKPTLPPAPVKKEEVKPKEPQAAMAPPPPVKKEEEMKPKAPQAAAATPPPEKSAPKPEAATGADKAKPTVAHESLAETVRRPGEKEQHDKQVKAEQEKKALAVSGWKERSMGELKGLMDMKWAEGLTDMKWADGVVEAARNNKEVVAVSIAAFSLGFLVSQKLFRK